MPAKDGGKNSNDKVKFKGDSQRKSAASSGVFGKPPTIANLSATGAAGGRGRQSRWSNYFSRLREWRRCLRERSRTSSQGLQGIQLWHRPRFFCRPFHRNGRESRNAARFRFNCFSQSPLPRWFIAIGQVKGLLLWTGFRQLGQCRPCRWTGFISLRVSVWFFRVAALGRMAARRFWRMD